MSRSLWAVFLAAILGLAGATSSVSSPSRVEGADSASARIEGVRQLTKTTHATTNNTLSMKLSDIPVGKVIQVGELKFVKVGNDQYVSVSPSCNDELTVNGVKNFDYTGSVQEFNACAGHTYKLEVWGAQGGFGGGDGRSSFIAGSNGAYAVGTTTLSANRLFYIYVGGQGSTLNYNANQLSAGGWNGGGAGGTDGGTGGNADNGGGGGGATDIALVYSANTYDSTKKIYTRSVASYSSRIIVAAGGSGGSWNCRSCNGSHGQTLSYSSYVTQTSGGYFGYGGSGWLGVCSEGCSGSGGGYWGGHTCTCSNNKGGSSYISGHTGCVAVQEGTSTPKTGCTSGTTDINCSYHYSGIVFTSTNMIAGNASMPNPRGSGNITGNSGNGYARITRLN